MTALEATPATLDSLKVVTLTDGEVWSARDLMEVAGYTDWRNWVKAIERARISVDSSGERAGDHFVESNKMVQLGSGARRQVEDFELTRYGCYILFQNADGSKAEIANIQRYFAIETRKQELAPAALELPTDYLSALKALVAREEANRELEAKITADAPKVEYVEEFVSSDDLLKFSIAAAQLGLPVGQLRTKLIDAGWIYKQMIGQRWSASKNDHEAEYEYRAYAQHAAKFKPIPQHNAPRYANGQVKYTLYIRAEALPAIMRCVFPMRAGVTS